MTFDVKSWPELDLGMTGPKSEVYTRSIFQTWKTHDVPAGWQAAQRSVVALNPGWQYSLLSDEDNASIVATHMPWFMEKFTSFPHAIQRADAIRYVLLYLFGGVYLDLDYVCLKSFDAIADVLSTNDIVLIRSNNTRSMITNSFMASRLPGHPFWLRCIKAMMASDIPAYMGKHLVVFKSTGPMMLSDVYHGARLEYSISLRTDLAVPCNICQLHACPNDSNYVIKPIVGSSWVSWDTRFYNWFFCVGFSLLVATLLMVYIVHWHFRKSRKPVSP